MQQGSMQQQYDVYDCVALDPESGKVYGSDRVPAKTPDGAKVKFIRSLQLDDDVDLDAMVVRVVPFASY